MNKFDYYNEEAERGLIRVLIDTPKLIGEIDVNPSDFVGETYRSYYNALRELYEGGVDITIASLALKVGEASTIIAGWHSSEYSSPTMLDSYSLKVKELSAMRKLVEAVEGKKSVGEVIELAKKMEAEIAVKRMNTFEETIDLYEAERERKRKQIKEGKGIGIVTGYEILDSKVCLERSHLDILAAKSSMGKSAFALNIARNAAMFEQNVLFFSVEMRAESLMDRLCAMISGQPIFKFKHMEERSSYAIAKNEFDTLKKHLKLEFMPSGTSTDICMLARKEAAKRKVDLIVVDYLQKLSDPLGKRTNNDRIGEMTAKFKSLAGELDCCVLALSQVNRQADDMPELYHLRDSGNIEQDADLVLMLAREDRESHVAEICVKKAREGEAEGRIRLHFEPTTTLFTEREQE